MDQKTRALLAEFLVSLFRPSDTYIRQEAEVEIPDETLKKLRKVPVDTLIRRALGPPPKGISSQYKLALWLVVGLTILSSVGASLVAFLAPEPLTSNQQTMFDTFNTASKMGIGAIVGLVGGKVT